MSPSRFEDAMERSFLFWLQDNIPSVDTKGKDGSTYSRPVQVLNCMPYEYYIEKKETHAVIDVRFSEISTEGYSIGGTFGFVASSDDIAEDNYRSFPWMYNIKMSIDVYTGSGMERMKIDGKIRELLELMRRGSSSCPVYEWVSDTSSASAYNTGAEFSVMNNQDAKSIHDEDIENNDFLSHWTVEAKCPYVIDSRTDLVTAFDLTTTLSNIL